MSHYVGNIGCHGCERLLKYPEAGYYKWRKARERAYGHAPQEHVLKEHIMAIHRLHPYYGYLRMTVALRKEVSILTTNVFIV